MNTSANHSLPAPPLSDRQDVVIIALDERAPQIREALADAKLQTTQVPTVVADHLMALGLVAQMRPSMVIASSDSMNGEAAATAAALRRLVPTATLLLLGPAERSGDYTAALDAGFDQYLAEPLEGGVLRQAVRAAVERRNGAATFAAEMAASVRSESLGKIRQQAPQQQGPSRKAQDSIGDVDLVDQLVRDPGQLPLVAVRLIAQQSGLHDLAWSRTLEGVAPDHRSMPVVTGDRTYGYLHAPAPATDEKLARWADWMSHWMALQQHVIDLWQLALKDELTGVWNRRYFNRFLTSILHRAADERFRVTVLVFDIDDFKLYNDRYGHGAGDDILRETARLMQSVVRDHDVVARIGGDEFAVIFWDAEAPRQPNSQHPVSVRMATERFQRALCTHKFPKLLEEARDTLTISAGLAGFPWDGRTPDELLAKADEMAMRSKQAGKDAVTFGPGALQTCDPE